MASRKNPKHAINKLLVYPNNARFAVLALKKPKAERKLKCRFCSSEENVSGAPTYRCAVCNTFLSDACSNITRLEDAICIKDPPCRVSDPLPDESTGPQPLPTSWCRACKLYRYVSMGFLPRMCVCRVFYLITAL